MFKVNLKCSDNLMNIEIKLRSIKENDKFNSLNNLNDNSKLSINKDQNKLNNTSNKNQSSINQLVKLEKNINTILLKINKSNKVDNIKRPIKKTIIKQIDDRSSTNNFNNLTTITNLINNKSIAILDNKLSKSSINNLTLTTLTKNINNQTTNRFIYNNQTVNITEFTIDDRKKQRIKRSTNDKKIKNLRMYFDGWQNIPDCLPEIKLINKSTIDDEENKLYKFQLVLQPANDSGLNCGLMRLRNKITDDLDYQHRIIIEYDEIDIKNNKLSKSRKDALLVNCRMPKANFFQTNQLLWWSSRIKQQMLEQLQQSLNLEKEEKLLKEHLKQTNKSDNKQILMTRSNLKEADKYNINVNENFINNIDYLNNLTTTMSTVNFSSIFNDKNQQQPQRFKRASSQPKFSDFLNNLPENFTETVEELIDFSGSIQNTTVTPNIHISVKQNSQLINSTSVDVLPGTPLEMQIYLDDESANVYGLLVSYLKVTDNNVNNSEILLLDGCSIDPYIFSNFESNNNGKSISSKFPAFRFPGSNYVLFIMTVNVCIGQCTPAQCTGNDPQQFAYGRRRKRRDLNNINFNDNNNDDDKNNFNHSSTLAKSSIATTTLSPSLLIDKNKNDYELKLNSSKRKDSKLNISNRPLDINKLYEVEMSTLIRVVKPKEIKSSLIKNEYRKENDLNSLNNRNFSNRSVIQLDSSKLLRRSNITRKIRKRYDSNQNLGKLSKLYLVNSSSTKSYFNIFIIHTIGLFLFFFLNKFFD